MWATFPPTQITPTVFLCTDISFSTAFLFYCLSFLFFFHSVTSLIINSWDAVCQYRSSEEAGGSRCVCVCGGTFPMHVRKLGYIKENAHTQSFLSLFFQLCTGTHTHSLSESFHLSWHPEDSLEEPYVSSSSSQQQYQDHQALDSYHANEWWSGDPDHLSACRQTGETNQLPKWSNWIRTSVRMIQKS